ncbi:TolC family protein [Photobacterium kishitanii]|uniref:TolC family protein n=1 Tax=Photobacterium kishitanii TaxID=318456 RepID=UPI000D15CC27|nr:TolC family protein [Photobacterium kishitanii]PSU23442.1 TolC family protein [Photobacterium kishitanii]
MTKIHSATTLIIAMSFSLWSLSSHALTMEQAWTAAKATNPDYKIKQLQQTQNQFDTGIARSVLLPDLSTTASKTWADHDQNSTPGYTITLSQSIWDSRSWVELDQAQAQVVYAQLDVKKEQNRLAYNVIDAYFKVAQAQVSVNIAHEQHQDALHLLTLTQKKYQAGLILSTEVDDANTNVFGAYSDLLSRQSVLAEKQAILAELINQPPQQVDEINSHHFHRPPLQKNTKQQWLKLAQDNSPNLLAAQQKLHQSKLTVKQQQVEYYPNLSGNISYSNDFNGHSDDLSTSITLKVPLDLNGKIRSQVGKAKVGVQIAQQQLRQVELDLTNDINTRFNQLDLDWQRVDIGSKKLQADLKALKTKQIIYTSGTDGTTALDIIQIQEKAYKSKESLQDLLYTYWLHRIQLLSLTGQLNDKSIVQLSQALQQ